MLKNHKKTKKNLTKNRVTGENMLKLLKLDDFSKYEREYLQEDQEDNINTVNNASKNKQ